MLDQTVRRYLDANRQRHLDELVELVAFPSISAQADRHGDCLACAEWLAGKLRALGLAAEVNTEPSKPMVLAFSEHRPGRPTLLVYGHYDVQPADPLEQWDSPPFQAEQREGVLYGRGVSDDKGQVYAWIKAAEAWKAAAGDFPVNLKFLIEGEEEVSSPTLEPFVRGNVDRLRCDHVAISDSGLYDERTPALLYGVRGIVYVEVTLTGPSHDLHSGKYGGAVANPLNALAKLIADLHDEQGRVTLPGFYDDVLAIAPSEHVAWESLGYSDEQLKAEVGADALAGEEGFMSLERMWGRPTLDCNGLWGGYTGQGPKTVLPSWAKAKISCRLVCRQKPDQIAAALREHFETRCPPGTRGEVTVMSAEQPWQMPPDSPALAAAKSALTEAFGAPAVLIRSGGSIPITAMVQRHLGVDPLMMGFGLPDDRAHSPNERMKIDHYCRGIVAAAALMANLAAEEGGRSN